MSFLGKGQFQFHFDLGIRSLLKEWRKLFSTQGLKEDVVAGTTVACIAAPLCLAISLASGVAPVSGLISGIIAGVVCALFGGTPLAVSGPAAAMAVLVSSIVQDYGVNGLLFVVLGCGILQVLSGVFSLGRIIRFVPFPVVAGFTAGIGAIILIGQLPRALGLPPPDQSHVLDVITHIRELIHETRLTSLGLALGTLSLTLIVPRLFPRLPATLVAVIVPSVIVALLGIDVSVIGKIPESLPPPKLPSLSWAELLKLPGITLIAFSLASLETLLSSSSVDKLSKTTRHNPDQELIGQGLGNLVSSLFGGLPVTGVIARSALNVQAGAKTRRSSIIHSLILLASVYFLAPLMGRIPTAGLAGILLSVSLRMLHPREFFQLWKTARGEAIVYVITFLAVIFVDLVIGVEAGVVAALMIAAVRLGKAEAKLHVFETQGPAQISVRGPLTFLSSSQIELIRKHLGGLERRKGVVIDLSEVTSMDASGASELMIVLEELKKQNTNFVLKGLEPGCRRVLMSLEGSEFLANHVAANESDILNVLDSDKANVGQDRLIYGVERFRRELRVGYEGLFEKLAKGQSPHTLFITCSDSRINPNLITSTDPGELFIVRNVGNIIPPFGQGTSAEGAAVEFAISVLGVKDIVVCGHSGCGAMSALLSDATFSEENRKKLPSVVRWLEGSRGLVKQLPKETTCSKAAELNALIQLENLKTYPIIKEKLLSREVQLHVWYYDIGKAELEEWDESRNLFVRVGAKVDKSLEKRVEAGIQFQAPFVALSESR